MDRRIWELDMLRAVAILLMIAFHIIYDMKEFAGFGINYKSGFWYWEGKLAAVLFMFVSGISSGLSNRNIAHVGWKIFGVGMVITGVTYVFLGDDFVRFGILHFLGISMVLYPLLSKFHKKVLFELAIVIAIIGVAFKNITINTILLLPVGLMYPGFHSADYYPLAPYLSVYIVGMIVYKSYYYKRESLFNFQYHNQAVQFLSRNSLRIYLIHQPMIIGLILLLQACFSG